MLGIEEGRPVGDDVTLPVGSDVGVPVGNAVDGLLVTGRVVGVEGA